MNTDQVSDNGGDCCVVSREARRLLKVSGIQILHEQAVRYVRLEFEVGQYLGTHLGAVREEVKCSKRYQNGNLKTKLRPHL